MKAKRFGLLVSGSALACLFFLPGADMVSSAEKTTIRLASPFKAGHILVEAAEAFKERIEAQSKGAIAVEIQAGAASEEDINDWCSQGKIEMQSNGHRALEVFAPQYFFFNAPYVMKDLGHFLRVWDGALGKKARHLKADGSEGDLLQIASFKLNEVQSHLTITNHLVQTGGILIHKPFFQKLSKAHRAMVAQAAEDATAWSNEKIKKGEKMLFVDLQRKGMQAVLPDAESFRQAARPAVEDLFQKEWPVTTWAEVLAKAK